MENIAASILTIVPAVILVPRVLVVAPMHGVLVMVSVFGVLRTLLTQCKGRNIHVATSCSQHVAGICCYNMLQKIWQHVASNKTCGNFLIYNIHIAKVCVQHIVSLLQRKCC